MKILQTPPRFYPYIGGTEHVALCLGKQLVNRGHQVKVICANEPTIGDGIIEGILVQRLPYRWKIANTNMSFGLPQALLKENFDLLHTHLPHPWWADCSAVVASMKKKPIFLTYHNDITGQGINHLIANCYNMTALKMLLRKTQKIFITQKNYLLTSPFLKPYQHKIVLAPLGVDTQKFKPSPKQENAQKRIFFLSNLDEFHRYKGLDDLIKATSLIQSKILAHLYIGGNGTLVEEYRALAKEQGVSDRVHFLGFLNDNELVSQYNQCDVFVLPSVSSTQEGFGLVALEAMACAKPVVVSDIVGVASDVKKNNAGIVVSPRNIEALAGALKIILSSPNEALQMGNSGLKLVQQNYTWNNHTDIVEQEYLKSI